MIRPGPNDVLVRLRGGLGNCLFQLAAGVGLAVQRSARLVLTTAEGSEPRVLRELVDLDAPTAGATQLIRVGLVPEGSPAIVDLLVRAARTMGHGRRRRLGSEGAFAAPPSRLPRRGPVAVVGYSQHPQYWQPGIEYLLDAIIRRRPERYGQTEGPVLPVLNVRRGDYVTLGWSLGIDYYRKGIRRLSDLGVDLSHGVRVIADDELAGVGVAEELTREGWRLIVDRSEPSNSNDTKALQDFWAIADAPAVIMSNSTFCWWATAVGDRMQGHRTVAFPSGWIAGRGDILRREAWIPV